MPQPNQQEFIRKLLYNLKMAYGSRADIYYDSGDTLDLATGAKTVVRVKYGIRRAICLPTVTSSESLLPGGLSTVWRRGGAVEWGDRAVAVDRRDLPTGVVIGTDNWSVVIGHDRYEVIKSETFGNEAAYLLTLKALEGVRAYEQVDVRVTDRGEVVDGAEPG